MEPTMPKCKCGCESGRYMGQWPLDMRDPPLRQLVDKWFCSACGKVVITQEARSVFEKARAA